MIVHKLPAMPRPRELAELGQRWQPLRSLASLYLWRIADFAKEQK
jgi:DNA-3-methyladenine glycosylase II